MRAPRLHPAVVLLVVVAIGCTGTAPDPSSSATTPADEPSSTVSPPTPSPEPAAEPFPDPIPARTPRGIAAITESGDVVLIDLDTLAARTIASYPPVDDVDDPDFTVFFFLTDIVVIPDGRILISSCCEPAAGYIRVLNEKGKEVRPPIGGDDPEIDPSGTRLAMAFLQSLAISPASLHRGEFRDIDARGRYSPFDPGWSPDGERIIYSLVRRLGLVEATAGSLREAQSLESGEGIHWGSTAYLRSGPLAVEIDGNARQQEQGPSRIVRVNFATGRRRVLVSSTEAITDLATDRAGKALLWVEGGTIHWRVGAAEGSLAGEYLKAAFFPG